MFKNILALIGAITVGVYAYRGYQYYHEDKSPESHTQ